MPEWVVDILKQFPFVVLVGVAVWLALRYRDKRQDEFLKREEALIKDFTEATEKLAAAFKDALSELDTKARTALDREKKAHDARIRAKNAEIR